MPEKHIVLLPREGYWGWVKAVQKYALAFGVNVTPDPGTAGRHLYPDQTVTVASAPGAYPQQGDIAAWFQEHHPEAELDLIEVSSPDDLAAKLQARVEANDRYGQTLEGGPFRLHWPTDYPTITQPFGANPEIYGRYGLPGHEGLDIRAPLNTNIYACASGEVYRVHDDPDTHAYGRHIRVSHPEGFRTVYAHLARILVVVGQKVSAKQVIGLADSTGNSTGSHLHLALKKDGATAAGLTHYPNDILDPTPFMLFPGHVEEPASTYPWPLARCLVGLNSREDGTYAEADFEVVDLARLEAVKVMHNTSGQDIARLKQINPAVFLMARAYYRIGQNKVLPADWVNRMQPDLERMYQLGIRYFEIHRTPNLQSDGWSYSWESGSDFARWWIDVVNRLRDRLPEGKFGFPGVLPGGQVEGQRFDAKTFIEQADQAILMADWVGVNCFWTSEQQMNLEGYGRFYTYMRSRFPYKLMFLTEFANVDELTNLDVKGREYVAYYQQLRTLPGVGAAFANVMSSRSAYGKMRWRREDGTITKVVYEVGGRNF